MMGSDHDNRTPEKRRDVRARADVVLDTLRTGGVFTPNEVWTRK